MDKPFKVIWKYKNDNRYTQYNTYIFIGELHKNLDPILKTMELLNFFDTLIQLNKQDIKKLEDVYGDKWYNYFFNMYHIAFMISQINLNKSMSKELIDKFGEEWFNTHIKSHTWSDKKILYSYGAVVKDEKSRKTIKKGRLASIIEDEEDMDYKISGNANIQNILAAKLTENARPILPIVEPVPNLNPNPDVNVDANPTSTSISSDDTDLSSSLSSDLNESSNESSDDQSDEQLDSESTDLESDTELGSTTISQAGGGDDDDDIIDDLESDVNVNTDDIESEMITDSAYASESEVEEEGDDFEKGINDNDIDKEQELDMDEIEKLYQHDDVNADQNTKHTTDLIKKALNDEGLFKKNMKNMAEFDTDKDSSIHAEKLRQVFTKVYVKTQYINGDDTIKTVKDKICCAIKNNKKFGDTLYLIPSRQYLWSEYIFNDQIEKVMIGQKWIRRNELLDIDVEPDHRIYLYEQLKDKLNTLRHNIRRYGNKIRWENDENNILFDYENYVTNNDIYMLDVYNELGSGYKPDQETLKNLQDVYFRIYFPKLRPEDIKNIIDYLNGDAKTESLKITKVFDDLNNDQVMENEIADVVENVRKKGGYQNLFKDNFVTQSVIHVNLRMAENTKLDLYRIFNEFKTSTKYPYIQYQTVEGGSTYKYDANEIQDYSKDKENVEVLYKWFENAPYGISFKVKIDESELKSVEGATKDKFRSIGLNESGRIEYKTQWQESDGATIDDIEKTYKCVKDLIDKINSENNRTKLHVPFDEEFRYAFINTIQKFELPEKFTINHNDLREFSRYFYPYVALVIEPRKRQAKVPKMDNKSKFGTYLRYKRVSKYENQARLEQRIIYFLRNFEFQDNKLASELAKQFNITEEKALEDILKAKAKYPHLKKSRKVLKKLDNVPKYKPPGIGIDIQGKKRENYKIRISGARNKEQLSRIIDFMNILIYLYLETYLIKKPERQILKEKLKKLTNIAKSRSKVDELVDHTKDVKTVKQMTALDKRRIGFKPEKGQNQWTRSCQNSGNDKKRRPQHYVSTTLDQLLKKGYTYNKKTELFEKKFSIGKGKNKEDIMLRTIRLPEQDLEGVDTGNYIHYACDPEDNGEHMYIGFLTRSTNPNGLCMPCCFRKDPSKSNNKIKRDFFQQCLSAEDKTKPEKLQKTMGDKLYILQDTNKIQEGRYGFLSTYLDRYFNLMLDKNKKIKHHYLEETKSGYYFKYGSIQDKYQFLNAIGATLDLNVEDIRTAMINALIDDKSDQIFTSLNNGDIKTQFTDRDTYIAFLQNSNYLDFDVTNNLISVPGVLKKGGLNVVIFHKRDIKVKKTLEKERIIEDFQLDCMDAENYYTIIDPKHSTIFLIHDGKNYYPIVLVVKDDKNSKTMEAIKVFSYGEEEDNIVKHVSDFFIRNCSGSFVDSMLYVNFAPTAKKTSYILGKLEKNYNPRYQVVDVRNKCKYVITNGGILIPVRPSGALWDIQIIKSFDRYINEFKSTMDELKKIYDLSNKELPVKPIGVYYQSKKDKTLKITAIMTKSKDIIPIQPIEMTIEQIESMGLLYENRPLTDKIDDEISKGRNNFKIDDRILKVNEDMFIEESYELFRLEFSNYINQEDNKKVRVKLEKIIESTKITKDEKVDKIRLMLYRLIEKNLYDKYTELINMTDDELDKMANEEDQQGGQQGGKINKFIHRINKMINVVSYNVDNDRKLCSVHKTRDECNANSHCRYAHGECYLGLTVDMIVMFVNRISEELAQNELKAYEIMRISNYFVSDIVDRNKFTEIKGQKIIISNSSNIRKILQDLFGKDNVPNIGKRRTGKIDEVEFQELNQQHPMVDMRTMYVQKIIDNNISIFRAYANGYYWIKNKYYDIESRNLGYYNPLQSDLANNFKSLVIDWLNDSHNSHLITEDMIKDMSIRKSSKHPIREFINRLAGDVLTLSNCNVELTIISKINPEIPVIVLDEDNKIISIFDAGTHITKPTEKDIAKYDSINAVNIRFNYVGPSVNNAGIRSIPDSIEIIYYKDSKAEQHRSVKDDKK